MNIENKKFEEIMEYIDILNSKTPELYQIIIENLRNFPNLEQKKELYTAFIKKLKKEVIVGKYSNQENLEEEIFNIRETLLKDNEYILVEEILLENKFNLEDISFERKNEIDKINEEIERIEDKYKTYQKYSILSELEDKKKDLTKKQNQIQSKIEKIVSNKANSAIDLSTILDKESLILEIKDNLFDIDKIIENINNNTLTEEKIKEIIEKYNIDLNTIKAQNIIIEQINKEIEQLTIEKELYSKESTEKIAALKIKQENIISDENWITENAYVENDETNTNSYLNIRETEELLNFKKMYENIENEINEIIKQEVDLKNKILDKINAKEELDKLRNLKFIRSTYNTILEDAITKFGKKSNFNSLAENINNFINNHLRISKLNKYEKSEKLKTELQEKIINEISPKIILKKEKNIKLLKKSLISVSGFATGMLIANVSGISTIKMGIAVTKLAGSAINLWTKNHQESRLATVKNNIITKIDNVSNDVENKYPGIKDGINKVKEIFKNPNVNYFLNGMAVGYTAGHLLEKFDVIERIENWLYPETEDLASDLIIKQPSDFKDVPVFSEPPAIEDSIITEKIPVIDEIPDIPEIEILTEPIIPKPGEIFDLSSITEGYTNPSAENAIDIMESLGKEVAFDKAVELPNGKIMWHFKRLNGAGYAWFDSEVVQELLSKTTEVVTRSAR